MRSALLTIAWLGCAGVSFGVALAQRADAQHVAAPLPVYGYDLQGNAVRRLATPETPAVVLFFLATDCPISNRYVPEIERLAKQLAANHVAVWLAYPNATETAEAVLRHQSAYGMEGATLVRPSQRLMTLIHPTVTPESAVLVPQAASGKSEDEAFKAVYTGRIDDRYLDIGRERPHANRHDLEEAVAGVLDHRPAPPPGGPPVGCGIITEASLHSGERKP